MNHPVTVSSLMVGDVVEFTSPMQGVPKGTKAYVYFQSGARLARVHIITETGDNLGSFSEIEQQRFFSFKNHSYLGYVYSNPETLKTDWVTGYFAKVFL